MGLPTSAWANNTGYALGQFVTNGGKTYQCVQAGTSAVSPATGPSGTGASIVDNTCLWDYVLGGPLGATSPTGWDVTQGGTAGDVNLPAAPVAAGVAAVGFAANAQPASTLLNAVLNQIDRLLLWLVNVGQSAVETLQSQMLELADTAEAYPTFAVTGATVLPIPTLYTSASIPTSEVVFDQHPGGVKRLLISMWLKYTLATATDYGAGSVSGTLTGLPTAAFLGVAFVRASAGGLIADSGSGSPGGAVSAANSVAVSADVTPPGSVTPNVLVWSLHMTEGNSTVPANGTYYQRVTFELIG